MHASVHKSTYPPAPLWGSTAVRVIAVLQSCSPAVPVTGSCTCSPAVPVQCLTDSCPTVLLSLSQVISQQSVFSVQCTVPLLKWFPARNGTHEIANKKKSLPVRWRSKPYKIRYGSARRPNSVVIISVSAPGGHEVQRNASSNRSWPRLVHT